SVLLVGGSLAHVWGTRCCLVRDSQSWLIHATPVAGKSSHAAGIKGHVGRTKSGTIEPLRRFAAQLACGISYRPRLQPLLILQIERLGISRQDHHQVIVSLVQPDKV